MRRRIFDPSFALRPRPFDRAYGARYPFGRSGLPLDLEIGAGTGQFALAYASRHPDRVMVAIEHTWRRFSVFNAAAQRSRLSNLLAVHANAQSWVPHVLPLGSADRVFILYPNPYLRRRDRGRRWYLTPFMGYLLQVLRPGGTLTLATNIASYVDEALTVMAAWWGLGRGLRREIQPHVTPGRTGFESKYLTQGQTCYEALWVVPPRQHPTALEADPAVR